MKILGLILTVLLFSAVLKAQQSPPQRYDTWPRFNGECENFEDYILNYITKPDTIKFNYQTAITLILKVDTNGKTSLVNMIPWMISWADTAFIRVIDDAPLWTPALLNYKPVNYYFALKFDVDLIKASQTMKVTTHYDTQPSTRDENGYFIYSSSEALPRFPGGYQAYQEFLKNNIRYPKVAQRRHIQGLVLLQAIVNRDGSFVDLKIVRDIGGGLGAEAMRVLNLSPRWLPAKKDSRPMRMQWLIPVKFAL